MVLGKSDLTHDCLVVIQVLLFFFFLFLGVKEIENPCPLPFSEREGDNNQVAVSFNNL